MSAQKTIQLSMRLRLHILRLLPQYHIYVYVNIVFQEVILGYHNCIITMYICDIHLYNTKIHNRRSIQPKLSHGIRAILIEAIVESSILGVDNFVPVVFLQSFGVNQSLVDVTVICASFPQLYLGGWNSISEFSVSVFDPIFGVLWVFDAIFCLLTNRRDFLALLCL